MAAHVGTELLQNSFVVELIEKKVNFNHFKLKTFQDKLNTVVSSINNIVSKNTEELKKEIKSLRIFTINDVQFDKITKIILQHISKTDDFDAFCISWQYIKLHLDMNSEFKLAQKYLLYKCRRSNLDKTLANLNPVKNRFNIESKERKGELVIEWPKANLISNGQRDILVFISKLMECEFQAGENCILIIDEFFDYLDDANVVAFQYYVSSLIERFRKRKQLLFPILLTHLDPNYLKHFCFNDKKMNVCYLQDSNAKITNEIKKVVISRDEKSIKDIIDKYYFHYHDNLDRLDFTQEFKQMSLNKDWGKPLAFKKKISRIFRTYLFENEKQYDPLAVCMFIRTYIEEKVYNELKTNDEKEEFLLTHTTNEKLHYAQEHGVLVSDLYFLLGIIYNHPLHLNENEDISKPLGMKLDNPTIKSMICNLCNIGQTV